MNPPRRRFLLSGLALSLVSLAACGDDSLSLPDFAADDPTRRAYRIAHANPAIFEQLPCYCGCGIVAEHGHLRDCFITDDGGWEEHAAYCSTCVEEALDAGAMLTAGATVAEIRAAIDAAYSGLGPPTDTPPVTS